MGYLRFYLALSVALSHAGFPHPMEATYAVQFFFVISGYYMALILDTTYKDDAPRFYLNRALRIFPAYWIVAGVTLAYLLYKDSYWPMNAIVRSGSEPLTILANVAIFGQDLLFTHDPQRLLIQPAWSIAMELCFYALAPLLVKTPTKVLIPLAVVLSWQSMHILNTPAQLCYFIAGIVLYRTGFAIKHKSALDTYLGKLAYPMYLIHFPLLHVFGVNRVIALPLTIALSAGLLLLLEPIERKRIAVRAVRSPEGLQPNLSR